MAAEQENTGRKEERGFQYGYVHLNVSEIDCLPSSRLHAVIQAEPNTLPSKVDVLTVDKKSEKAQECISPTTSFAPTLPAYGYTSHDLLFVRGRKAQGREEDLSEVEEDWEERKLSMESLRPLRLERVPDYEP